MEKADWSLDILQDSLAIPSTSDDLFYRCTSFEVPLRVDLVVALLPLVARGSEPFWEEMQEAGTGSVEAEVVWACLGYLLIQLLPKCLRILAVNLELLGSVSGKDDADVFLVFFDQPER